MEILERLPHYPLPKAVLIVLIGESKMKRMNFKELIAQVAGEVAELFPWEVIERQQAGENFLLLDVRCPSEYQVMHIADSLNVPRGILETACDYGYEETEPELVEARDRNILVICRSGNRSVLAAHTLHLLGYEKVYSLKTGLRGWNDYELLLEFSNGNPVPFDTAEKYFHPQLSPEQMGPA
jgi:rhodanese-related sulfurtransferase